MKLKTAALAESRGDSSSSGTSSKIPLDQQICEFLARKPAGMPLPAALKEIQASFAIEGMHISDERLAACAERYMAKVKSGEARRLIEQAKADFPQS